MTFLLLLTPGVYCCCCAPAAVRCPHCALQGRSRGNNYDNDDSYGYKDSSNYKDGYATKRRAPMPRVYPDDDDYYPSKQTVSCWC